MANKKIIELETTQLSFFEEDDFDFQMDGNDLVEYITVEEMHNRVIAAHHWEKDYILYFNEVGGEVVPELWHMHADLALLDNNCVFYRKGFQYPFMKAFDTKNEAMKFYHVMYEDIEEKYQLAIEPYKKGDSVKVVHNHDVEFEDMHLHEQNEKLYGCKEYVNNQRGMYSFVKEKEGQEERKLPLDDVVKDAKGREKTGNKNDSKVKEKELEYLCKKHPSLSKVLEDCENTKDNFNQIHKQISEKK